MAKKSSKDAPRAPLALDADLRIGAAPALRDALLGALAAGEAVQLDGTAVTQIDTAGLQVLAAFSRDARAAGLPVAWTGVSDPLRRGVSVLGLHALIELPAEAGVN
ncbi:STAS domain-containing protein [Luteibacter sp. UNCMF366Tsu5.1]|uniref:STAS domain-containing protein n=1 Tax=Luteibacter sp. UNCMF366Tsu5.1 TaxID=1502758 RepID=UPI0009091B31|nr:STAS domain-containing protein [Luteibacter sp. UNCMF366Tsu5.1]SFW62537.1 Anti-anti-sigma regulatory factor (antagonist of anti-sigma factor) [Luteibacter sp. UNCMF366Tsu5.1]